MKSATSFSVVLPGVMTAGESASARICSVFRTASRIFAISAGVLRLRNETRTASDETSRFERSGPSVSRSHWRLPAVRPSARAKSRDWLTAITFGE